MPASRQPRAKTGHRPPPNAKHDNAATASTTAKTEHRNGLPPRAKSTSSKPSRPQTRSLRTNATATTVYKPADGNGLVDGINRLSINPSPPPPRRNGSAVTGSARVRVGSVPRQCKTVEDIARVILAEKAKNIIVMVGAGISTPSGIPDFRTPGTGLYDNLRQYRIPFPQAIFDIDYFESHPKPFYMLAKELYPTGKYRPNYTHYFLRMLHEKGMLLRVYTQNIDGLERMAGVPPMKIVEAHGTFLTSSCIKCQQSHPSETVKTAVFNDKLPRCRINGCMGLVKPNIVFFGEDLPRRFYYYMKDFPQADLLLVMGTSLEVEPFASIVDSSRFFVPRILFNREAVGPFKGRHRGNDVVAKGDLIRQVRRFVGMLGWTDDLNALIEESETKNGYALPIYDCDDDTKEEKRTPVSRKNSSTSQPPPKPANCHTPGTTTTSQKQTAKKIVPNLRPQPAPAWANNSQSSNSQTRTRHAEIAALKNMFRANSLSTQASASTSSLLPKIGGGAAAGGASKRVAAFHAQTRLFRSPHGGTKGGAAGRVREEEYFDNGYESESATSESEEDDDSSSDGEEEEE